MSRERILIAPAASDHETRRLTVVRARRRGFRSFVLGPQDEVVPESGEEHFVKDGDEIRPAANGIDRPTILIESIGDPESLERLLRKSKPGGAVAIRWLGDRLIPLENVVAARAGRFELWVVTDRPRDVPGALGALEHGADRVVVEIADVDQLDELEPFLDAPAAGILSWELIPLTRVAPAGMGDRVLVDTTSILRPSEGLLIGSSAAFLFHVASEAVGSRYTRPRPFRVNAGAAHSYAMMADGTTRYLSEIEPGDAVLVAEPGGSARTARVGRVKIERRPLVLVEAEMGTHRYTVFLQEAETVRVSAETDRIATTHLEVGTRVHGVVLPPARHLGREVEETIDER